YLSLLAKKNLLPTVEEEQEIIQKLVELGGVDGISGHSEYSVDSFSLKENSQVLASIHQVLEDAGIEEKSFP
ncbi:MAG: glutamate cyclase domain-containing protein, partial [Dehalococcoidia bacterium]